MKGNLNRLALTFGRPVLGIHNRTSGVVFDVIECLIQRNFGYATGDIRICFKVVRDVLYDPRKSKVIFVLHSQGGIEGSLVLDWLLQELPQDLLAKLEVYTFGNAANHFNNPHRHITSQILSHKPWTAMNTVMTETTHESPAGSPQDTKQGIKVHIPPTLEKAPSFSSSRSVSAAKDRAIGHIEHYAHNTDFVAMWGVLHFATNRMGSRELPRFLGRLFARANGRGGHQLNQHYLDGMFPLKFNEKTKMYDGADDNNEFMNEVIKIGEEGDAMANAREAFEISWAGTHGFGSGEISTPVEVHGLSKKKLAGEVKVKDLSRLWCYRNGRSPKEECPSAASHPSHDQPDAPVLHPLVLLTPKLTIIARIPSHEPSHAEGLVCMQKRERDEETQPSRSRSERLSHLLHGRLAIREPWPALWALTLLSTWLPGSLEPLPNLEVAQCSHTVDALIGVSLHQAIPIAMRWMGIP
ncbi:hypothetical protein AUP68_03455 [Ilyonectria robusta]